MAAAQRKRATWLGLAVLALFACNRSTEPAGNGASATVSSSAPTSLAPLRGHARPLLFVSNEASGDLSVIDPTKNAVVATIPVGKRPRGVQRSPDGSRVYVALSGSVAAGPNAQAPPAAPDRKADAIGIIDTVSGTLADRIPSGTDPEQFAVSIDGTKLFVSNEDAAMLSVVDVSSKNVTASLPVGEEPEGVAASPDGRWVYATCESSSSVRVVDANKQAVVSEATVPARPRSAAFLPDSSKAYVTSEVGAAVTVFSVPGHNVVKTLKLDGPVRPMGIAISPDGSRAYVTTGHAGTVIVIDTAKDDVIGSIPVGQRPWGIALSADGKTFYTANGLSDDVSVVDVAAARETARIHVGSKPWGVVLVP